MRPLASESRSARFRASPYSPAVVVAVLALLIMVSGDATALLMRYQRAEVLQGQLWRLITGNLVHLGPAHLVLNLVGLALIFGLFGRELRASCWTAILVLCALTTTLGLLALSPGTTWYVGLSGILHGVFLAGALAQLRRGQRMAYLFVGVLILKLVSDLLFGAPAETKALIGGNVIVTAHLYGAFGGLLALVLPLKRASQPSLWRS